MKPPVFMERFLKKPSFHLIIIALAGLAAYSNTFDAPFQWDDKYLIAQNPVIKDLRHFLSPSEAKWYSEFSIFRRRLVSFLTFALNYRLHGLDVRGYHALNVAVHILNAMLVYAFARAAFNLSGIKGDGATAFLAALFFVGHPVQTEAVTYIFQRCASLAAFFYLLSMLSYIKWRRMAAGDGKRRGAKSAALYCLCLLSALAAMNTKETALTLPVAIMLFEFFFFDGPAARRLLFVLPLYIVSAVVPINVALAGLPAGNIFLGSEAGVETGSPGLDAGLFATPVASRWEYIVTQLRVTVTYLRLLFFPANQNLIYDYPIYKSIFSFAPLASLVFLVSILGLAVFCHRLSRLGRPGLRAVSFGIIWFFLTLSVESSILPLPMVIHEYRLYLPSVGIFIAAGAGAAGAFNSFRANAAVAAFSAALIFAGAAYARNGLWKDEIGLWEDTARKSPLKSKPHNNLGLAYQAKGLAGKALDEFETALALDPGNYRAAVNLGALHHKAGRTAEAVGHYAAAIKMKPDYAEAHYNLGVAYASSGLEDMAVEHLLKALSYKPDMSSAHYNLGAIYANRGLIDKAISHYLSALKIDPEDVRAHVNIGAAYKAKGWTERAIEHYQKALAVEPKCAEAHNNLGNAYRAKGLTDKAIESYLRATALNPSYASAHMNLGLAYAAKGLNLKSQEHLGEALRLDPSVANIVRNP